MLVLLLSVTLHASALSDFCEVPIKTIASD